MERGFAQRVTPPVGAQKSGAKKVGESVVDVTATEFADVALDSGRRKWPDHFGLQNQRGNKDENLKERAAARLSIRADSNS
jgi:hypothetical protein